MGEESTGEEQNNLMKWFGYLVGTGIILLGLFVIWSWFDTNWQSTSHRIDNVGKLGTGSGIVMLGISYLLDPAMHPLVRRLRILLITASIILWCGDYAFC